MSELRNLSYTVKSALRVTQQAYEQLAQSILVEEKRERDSAVLLHSALELVRDQQAFIASNAPLLGFAVQDVMRDLDARASTFTFMTFAESFPAKKESSDHGKE